MKRYIEIVETKTDKIVLRSDVTEKSEKNIERIEYGMNINLNHSKFFTRVIDSEKELPKV
jgi:hypothetical protein